MKVAQSLRFIQLNLLRLHRSGVKRSKLWLGGLTIAMILAVASSAHLRMLLSIDELMDSDFHTFPALTHLNHAFSDKNDLFLVLASGAPDHKLTKPELCSVEKWIFDEVDGRENFRKIVSIFGVARPETKNNLLSIRSVLDLHCEKDLASDATLVDDSLKEIQKSPWGKILTSTDASDIAISFYLNDTAKDLRYGSFDVGVVDGIMKSFKQSVLDPHPELEAHWAGVALHQFYLKRGMDQTAVLNLAMPLLVFFLFWVFFASARTGFLFTATIAVSSIIVYGVMAAFGCPMDVLANTLTLMLVLSSLEDFLFIVHANQTDPLHWRKAFRKLIMPGFFTSLTTAVGFASLYTSNLAIIRRFGLFAAFAALLEWVVVFILLPAFMERFPRFRTWMSPPKNSRPRIRVALEKLGRSRISKFLACALVLVYLFSAYGAFHLHVLDAPANIFPKNHIVSTDLKYLEKSRGWESQVSLVFADFSAKEKNRAISEEILKLPNVVTTEDPYQIEDYLLKGLSPTDSRRIQDLWEEAPSGARLIAKDNSARSILYLKKTDTASIDALSAEVTRLCPHEECHLAGTLVSYTEFGDRVLSTLLESLGLSLILVALILVYLLWAKRQRHYAATLISALWGPASLVCIFWLFDFPITYVTSTFASILVGLAGDNTIQYLFADRKGMLEDGVNRQAGASIQVTIMMMILSCVLFGSYFASIRVLASLFMMGFALTLIGDLWIFKGLLSLRRKH
jgi:hypothetical protein